MQLSSARPAGACDNSSSSTDDLDLTDNLVVTDWVFGGGGGFVGFDGNAQVGMPGDLVTKINGNAESRPAVGTARSTNLASVSFSIVIPAGTTLNLSSVAWDWRQATGSGNVRWLAFRHEPRPSPQV